MFRAIILFFASMCLGAIISIATAQTDDGWRMSTAPGGVSALTLARILDCGPVRDVKIEHSGTIDCDKVRQLSDTPSGSYLLRVKLTREGSSNDESAKFDLFAFLVSVMSGRPDLSSVGVGSGAGRSADTAEVSVPVSPGAAISATFGGTLYVPVDKALQAIPFGLNISGKESGGYTPHSSLVVGLTTAQPVGAGIQAAGTTVAVSVSTVPTTVILAISQSSEAGRLGTELNGSRSASESRLLLTAWLERVP